MAEAPKIVGLRGQHVPGQNGEPSPGLIARLEEMLADARSGALIGFAYACEHHDTASSWGYSGMSNKTRMIGALECIKFALTRANVDE